jgi:hypothetical protein
VGSPSIGTDGEIEDEARVCVCCRNSRLLREPRGLRKQPSYGRRASAFLDVARDQEPAAANYSDDVLTAMAEQVCQVLNHEHTTAGDALDVMDNYKSLTAEEQATIAGIAVGSACPEHKDKITAG